LCPATPRSQRLAGQQEAADAKVRSTVEGIIADVVSRGDAAVRELSERFHKWSQPSFRLSTSEIEALVAGVAPQTNVEIQFAQQQIGHFAEIQHASMQDIEVETLPGQDRQDSRRRSIYVDRILRGANPVELPAQPQPNLSWS